VKVAICVEATATLMVAVEFLVAVSSNSYQVLAGMLMVYTFATPAVALFVVRVTPPTHVVGV